MLHLNLFNKCDKTRSRMRMRNRRVVLPKDQAFIQGERAMPGAIRDRQQNFLLEQFSQPPKAGEIVEIANISANPEAVGDDAQIVKLRADEWGKLVGNAPDIAEGDYLRIRTRDSSGNVSNWISLQAKGLSEADTRNAQIYVDAIGLEANQAGEIELIYLGDGMVSEPNAQLRFTNQRTGQVFDCKLDQNGQLPPDLSFKGQGGDKFSIAISDGVNNADFREVAGVVEVHGLPEPIDLPDPVPWKKNHVNEDGSFKVSTKRFSGPLFVDGVSPEDVKQGNLANCYFPAAASAIANTNPQAIEDMIKDNGDGTYTVTFKEETYYNSGRYRERKVKVDGDLYMRENGSRPLYGSSTGSEAPDKLEMWYPLIEKAYATMHDNSYDNIGNGGHADKVMRAFIGGRSYTHSLRAENTDLIFRQLSEASQKGWPMTASTYGKDSEEAERYAGERIYPWHMYTVLGTEEENGTRYVKMRNPWGNSEPGYDGKDDGIFRLEIDKFNHFYRDVSIVKPK
jgi:hypothetical protein